MPVEVSHQTAYREMLKERILEVSMQAFATHGVRAVKMDDIAQMLGISKRTLYELYDNKEMVLRAGVEKYRKNEEETLKRMNRMSKNVIELILMKYELQMDEWKKTNPQFYSDLTKYPSVLKLLRSNRESGRQKMLQFLKRGVQEGSFRNDVDLELLAQLFGAIGEYVMQQRLYEAYPAECIYRNLVLVPLRGACTARGAQMLDAFFKEKKNSDAT